MTKQYMVSYSVVIFVDADSKKQAEEMANEQMKAFDEDFDVELEDVHLIKWGTE